MIVHLGVPLIVAIVGAIVCVTSKRGAILGAIAFGVGLFVALTVKAGA